MEYKITVQTFFRTPTGAEFVKDGKRYSMSADQLDCWIRQAKLMGFRIMMKNDLWVSLARVENEIEVFLDRLNRK